MRSRWSTFKELWILQFENYKHDIFNLFSGWVITLVILLVWLTFRDTNIQSDPFVLASAIGVVGIRNCSFNFTRTIFNFRRTNFFTRIFNTKISLTYVFFIIFLFNQVTNLITSVIFFGIGMLYQDQREKVVDVNWAMFLLGYFFLAIISNFIGFILGFTIKTVDLSLVIANFYYFGSIYFLGLGFPWTTISKYQGFVIASYFFPQRYAVNIMAAGWINHADMTINSEVDFGFGPYFWIPYVVCAILVFIGILTMAILLIKEFEFGFKRLKHLKRLKNYQQHVLFIREIRRAASIVELEKIRSEHKKIMPNKITKTKKTKKRI